MGQKCWCVYLGDSWKVYCTFSNLSISVWIYFCRNWFVLLIVNNSSWLIWCLVMMHFRNIFRCQRLNSFPKNSCMHVYKDSYCFITLVENKYPDWCNIWLSLQLMIYWILLVISHRKPLTSDRSRVLVSIVFDFFKKQLLGPIQRWYRVTCAHLSIFNSIEEKFMALKKGDLSNRYFLLHSLFSLVHLLHSIFFTNMCPQYFQNKS